MRDNFGRQAEIQRAALGQWQQDAFESLAQGGTVTGDWKPGFHLDFKAIAFGADGLDHSRRYHIDA